VFYKNLLNESKEDLRQRLEAMAAARVKNKIAEESLKSLALNVCDRGLRWR